MAYECREEDFSDNVFGNLTVDEVDAMCDLETLVVEEEEILFTDDEVDLGPAQTALARKRFGKHYKRQRFFDAHAAACDGKRKPIRKNKDESQVTYASTWVSEKMATLHLVSLVLTILQKKATDPVLGLLPGSPGARAQHLLVCLSTKFANVGYDFCAALIKDLLMCIHKGVSKQFASSGMLDMMSDIYTLTVSPQLQAQWMDLVSKSDVGDQDNFVCNFALQLVIDGTIPSLLQALCPKADHNDKSMSLALSKKEKQALHYAAGYIPRKLKSMFSRTGSNKAAKLFYDSVSKWTQGNSNKCVEKEIPQWTDMQNRGGLIVVNHEFFKFIVQVELVFRKIVYTDTISQFRDQDMVLVLIGEIKENVNVLSAWKDLIADNITTNELGEALFEEVVKCWIKMRGRQIVKEVMFSLLHCGKLLISINHMMNKEAKSHLNLEKWLDYWTDFSTLCSIYSHYLFKI